MLDVHVGRYRCQVVLLVLELLLIGQQYCEEAGNDLRQIDRAVVPHREHNAQTALVDARQAGELR